MNTVTSCITSNLAAYQPTAQNPWNEERVRHAYRRLGYDANKETCRIETRNYKPNENHWFKRTTIFILE